MHEVKSYACKTILVLVNGFEFHRVGGSLPAGSVDVDTALVGA
jgi:hypothetical protein